MESYRSEQELDEGLRLEDRYAWRYMQQLDRFADLPSCDSLIALKLKGEFPPDFFSGPEWQPASERPTDEEEEALMEMSSLDSESSRQMKRMQEIDARARQLASIFYTSVIDWSNIYSVLLTGKARISGIRLLYYFSRALGYLNEAMEFLVEGDMTMSVVLSRRSLYCFERGIAGIAPLAKDNPNLAGVFIERIKRLEEAAVEMRNHIAAVRSLGGGEV